MGFLFFNCMFFVKYTVAFLCCKTYSWLFFLNCMKMLKKIKSKSKKFWKFFWNLGRFVLKNETVRLCKKCPYLELFCSVFSRIRTEYGEIRSISPYSVVQMRENAD